MRIEHYLFGLIAFSLVLAIGFNVFLNVNNNYEIGADPGIFSDDLLKTSEQAQNLTGGLRIDTQTGEVTGTTTDADLYQKGYPAILNIFDVGSTFGKTIGTINKETGLIPPPVTQALMLFGIVSFAAFMIYMIWRFKPQND